MSRRLLVVNGVIGLLACLLVAALIREMLSPRPLPPPVAPRPAPAMEAPAAAPAGPVAAGYGVIADKNLFSPSRSEASAGPEVPNGPRPLLHGVVMNGGMSRAYLEDPVVKRPFGYAIGDTVAGGRVQSISADRVVIAGPDGLVEVLLQDPAKPRAGSPPSSGARAPAPPAAPESSTR